MAPAPLITPPIPDGPTSRLLKAAAAVSAAIVVVTAVLHGDHTPETLGAGFVAFGAIATFAAGKYAQTAAWIKAQQGRSIERSAG